MAETQAAAPEAGAKPAAGGSLVTKLLIVVFVVVVVAVECGMAYMMLPTRDQTLALLGGAEGGTGEAESGKADRAKASHGKSEHGKKGHGDKDKGQESGEQAEVDLGEFTVTAFRPASNSTLRIAFHLYGIVQASDGGEFNSRLRDNQHRFREQVIVTIRSAEVGDLSDAGLGLLKRTILEKTNALLGKPLVKTLIFSDFSFVELQ